MINFNEYKKKIDEIENWTKKEFSGIRTGAASIAILDNVLVEAYDSKIPLNQVANLSVEDAKSLFVAPFDTSIIKDIEKSLNEADLGLGISSTSGGIRISFPDLTSERREMLLKLAGEKLEDGNIRIRKERDEVKKEIERQEKEKEISQDEKFNLIEELDKITKDGGGKLDQIFKNKEEEISK